MNKKKNYYSSLNSHLSFLIHLQLTFIKHHGPAGKKMYLSSSKPVSRTADYDHLLSGIKVVEDTALKPVTRVINR